MSVSSVLACSMFVEYLTHILWIEYGLKASNEVEHYKGPGCWIWWWGFKDRNRVLLLSRQEGRHVDQMQTACSRTVRAAYEMDWSIFWESV